MKAYDKRQGDLYLFNTLDGGEISSINGEPVMDRGFETAVLLSIAGPAQPYWADEYLPTSRKMQSKLQTYIQGRPLSSGTLKTVVAMAKADLQWVIDTGVADKIAVAVRATARNRIEIAWSVETDGRVIEQNRYQLNWAAQRDYPASRRV